MHNPTNDVVGGGPRLEGALRRREFITLLCGAAVAWPLAAHAQQAGKVPFSLSDPRQVAPSRIAAFLEELRAAGNREPEQVEPAPISGR